MVELPRMRWLRRWNPDRSKFEYLLQVQTVNVEANNKNVTSDYVWETVPVIDIEYTRESFSKTE